MTSRTVLVAWVALGLGAVAQGALVKPRPSVAQPRLTGSIILAMRSSLTPIPVEVAVEKSLGPGTFLVRPCGNLDTAVKELRQDPDVRYAMPDYVLPVVKDAFTPNDPYYNPNQPATGWPGQWNLNNTFTPGRDLNVVDAWNRDLTGQGVIIGFIDDGFEFTHVEHATNYSAANSFDFGQNDTNVFPVTAADIHGTAVLGLCSARGGNGQGIAGVAPFSVWGGQRVDFANPLASQFVSATLFRSSGSTTTIKIKNHSYGFAEPFVDASAQAGAMSTSAASGTIHVRSAGNNRGASGEDANKHMERNSVDAICISALGSDGKFSSYTSFGANVFACAPSDSGTAGTLKILTTDRNTEANGFNGSGDSFPDAAYTSIFGGTSAAAPQIAGVLALAKQAQPALDTRFAKHLLARTSRQVDAGDTSAEGDTWRTNGAGLKFNQNYGFGLVDADALTLEAAKWASVSPLSIQSTGTISVGAAILDNNPSGTIRTFTLVDSFPQALEELKLTLIATHTFRGDLEAHLTSPSGTTSRVFTSAFSDAGQNLNWTFTINAFWGENPAGVWSLRVRDVVGGDSGTWTSFSAEARLGRLQRNLNLTVDLLDFSGTVPGRPVEVEIQPGSGSPRTVLANLGTGGLVTLPIYESGFATIAVRASHWLRKALSITLDAPAETLLAMLINGDVDGDNEVGPGDFGGLSSAFGAVDGDANWNAEADLDGDGEVGPSDFGILSSNFGLAGD